MQYAEPVALPYAPEEDLRLMSRLLVAIGIAAFIAGCAAINQQKALPPRTDDSQFKNLKVLPQNIDHDVLIETMRGYARSLGVRCDFCHVQVATTPREIFDFPADTNPHKDMAREMIVMTRNINREVDQRLKKDAGEVTCMTCHRGKKEPEVEELPPDVPQPTSD